MLVAGLFLVVRPRHGARETAAPEITFEEAARAPTPQLAVVPEPSPVTSVKAAVPIVEAPPAIDAPLVGDEPPSPPAPTPNRRASLIVNHNRRLQEADEQAFEILKFPEATRASIRQLNEEHSKQTIDAGNAAAAASNRQDALRLLLGPGAAKDFDSQERAAVQRLRGKYRFEWGRQLRQ
ncbi:MAG TPA: hypothetical protein VGL59_06730 [Polyangia bacterium]